MARKYAPDVVRKIILDSLVMYRDQMLEDAAALDEADNPLETPGELKELASAADEIHTKVLDNDYEIVWAKHKGPKKGGRK